MLPTAPLRRHANGRYPMDEPDPAPDARTNVVMVPVLNHSALGELEARRTLWFLAGEGNTEAKQAPRAESDG